MKNYLIDSEFLLQLDKTKNKSIYVRMIALNNEDLPTYTIEGRATQGSINIDGSSAVTRTCSLTMVAQGFDFQDYYFAFKTRFKLEVGVENVIDERYPPICWFEQGIFVITNISTSRSNNNFTITIQGKDKMCLLDGTVGGTLEAQTDFGKIEEEDADGNWNIRNLPLKDIIRNIVHVYGHEPYHNIIINDFDTYGLELLEYRGNKPIYIIRNSENEHYNLYQNRKCYLHLNEADTQGTLISLDEVSDEYFMPLTDKIIIPESQQNAYFTFQGSNSKYKISKIEYGNTAGYKQTELVYAGDLIGNVGETLKSILDKIQKMLVEFEFFYDIKGRFIFQKKRSFLNTIWTMGNNEENLLNETDMEGLANYSVYSYMFSGTELLTALNNSPNISNVKNDYSIWGQRTSVSGAKIPIHLRYAIDVKPSQYTRITVSQEEVDNYNKIHGTTLPAQEKNTIDFWSLNNSKLAIFEKNWTEGVLLEPGSIGYHQTLTPKDKFYITSSDIQLNCYNYTPEVQPWENITITYYLADGTQQQSKINWIGTVGKNPHSIYFDWSKENQIPITEIKIDIKKPSAAKVSFFDLSFEGEKLMTITSQNYDWREVIYQMALDYYKYNWLEDFETRVAEANAPLYPQGITGYEQYYIDLEGFWRQLYNPDIQTTQTKTEWQLKEARKKYDKMETEIKKWQNELDKQQDTIIKIKNDIKLLTNRANAETDLEERKSMLLEIKSQEINLADIQFLVEETQSEVVAQQSALDAAQLEINQLKQTIDDLKQQLIDFNLYDTHWNRMVFEKPEQLNFWFDFLDADNELGQFSVKSIGTRTKVVNESNINSIYFRDIPNFIYVEKRDKAQELANIEYSYMQVQNIDNLFTISAQGTSAKDRLDDLIYQHSYSQENVSLTSIPIYYLEPNTRIHIYDKDTNINGDYILTKIGIPLTYNGTMSLTASKAAEYLI